MTASGEGTMTKADIDKFIVQLEQKNSWGKNEVIDLFKEWVILVLLAQANHDE